MISSKSDRKIALATKLAFGFGVLILILAGVTVGIFIAAGQIKDRAQHAQEESVVHAILAKDMKIHVLQVQEFLTDIAATRALDGFDDGFNLAEQRAQEFHAALSKFQEMFRSEKNHEGLRDVEKISRAFEAFYQVGKRAAQAYIQVGPSEGNKHMAEFDKGATELLSMLNAFVLSQTDELDQSMASIRASVGALVKGSLLAGVSAVLIGVVLAILIIRSISRPVGRIIGGLSAGAEQTSSAAEQVSSESQSLAQGASEQAAAFEETTSSLEEITSMIKQNADNAGEAKELTSQAQTATDDGLAAMERMAKAIDEIKVSSDETAAVMKTIDEIAFQTNLLALNAAVEAARAGDAGKGFAVVAEEVRNLARRSAEASKNTSAMIAEAVKNADNGVKISQEVSKALGEITQGNGKVSDLVAEIAAASSEQARGIEQINTAVSQMDQVTQGNAASAEESASAAEELSSQSQSMNDMVRELVAVIEGSNKAEQASDHFRKIKTKYHGASDPRAPKPQNNSAKSSRQHVQAQSHRHWQEHMLDGEVLDQGENPAAKDHSKPEMVIPMVAGKSMDNF